MQRDLSSHQSSIVPLAASAVFALFAAGCATPATAIQPEESNTAAAAAEPAAVTAGARCVTIERGGNGDVADARIGSGSPDRNYGELATLCAGQVDQKERLSLFQFDLSMLPPEAKIVRARLSLRSLSASEAPFTVHRVAAAWDEGDVTWDSFEEAFDRKAEATLRTRAGRGTVAVADITPLVREWVAGTSENHGIALRSGSARGPLSLGTFFSSEAENAADRPRLEVCFADPATAL